MPTEEDFLRALRAHPKDDAPWLMYADWLTERGDPWGEVVRTRQVVNSIGMRLLLLPPGTFLMGSPEWEPGRGSEEGPWHRVTLPRPFALGVTPVTQRQYQAVVGENPSWFSAGGDGRDEVREWDTGDFPVECVNWDEAVAFCRALSARPEEEEAGRLYRLPTEAEWEYACRGGSAVYQVFAGGDTLSSARANFDGGNPYGEAAKGPFLTRTSKVGTYPPNGFGLYDLHGNVWEWCADWYDAGYYQISPRQDPAGPSTGAQRVIRGGGWNSGGLGCRSARRGWVEPSVRGVPLGFRVALVPSGR